MDESVEFDFGVSEALECANPRLSGCCRIACDCSVDLGK